MDIYNLAESDIDDLLAASEDNNWTGWDGLPYSGESALEYGPGHTVWSDENFDDVRWNIKECDSSSYKDWRPGVIDIVRRSLQELDNLPQEIRNPPSEYDGEHPENYPPHEGMEMVK